LATLEELNSYGLILAPFVAMLFDVMIGQNIETINRLGIFIRDTIESRVEGIKLWETAAAQHSVRKRCYGWMDVVVLLLLTLGTCIIVLCVLWTTKGVPITIPLCFFIVAFAGLIYHMWKTIIRFEP
jgi:hypothetical protein